MKRVTLYGFYGAEKQVWYFNGYKWRYYSGKYWCDGVVQDWSQEEFDKSLTVNNFKEKRTISKMETVERGNKNAR